MNCSWACLVYLTTLISVCVLRWRCKLFWWKREREKKELVKFRLVQRSKRLKRHKAYSNGQYKRIDERKRKKLIVYMLMWIARCVHTVRWEQRSLTHSIYWHLYPSLSFIISTKCYSIYTLTFHAPNINNIKINK